jgi:predicted PurR-regulated permease PerM
MSGAMALTTLGVLIFLRFIGVEVTHIFSLSLIAGLCVFIPVIGPILAAIPAALSVVSGGFIDITIVIFAYFCIQQIEGFILIPRIQGNSLKLSDFEVIFWMTLSGSLFGILGILVTLPLLAVSKILLEPDSTQFTKKNLKKIILQ